MNKSEAQKRIQELRRTLWENSRKYYVENAPAISDYDYDHLMYELEELEKEFPEFDSPDSPTHKVGSDLLESYVGQVRKEFAQYPHKFPMLSLGNTYSIGEIEDFAVRASRMTNSRFTYSCELKFDGTAICLTYKNGQLYRALTRGDGKVGDDVTENALKISNIPHTLSGSGYPEELEIRGEIVMPYSAFDSLNKERIDNGEPAFANPRNAASGSLKLLDSNEVARRGLMCILYHIPAQSIEFETHSAAMKAAASWGLPVSDKSRVCADINEIEDYITTWDKDRKYLPYATDGIVIKINETLTQVELGYTAKFPRWAVAYKFKPEQALTRLESIDYQVGRTGAVTPVANLSPVQLSGTVVKRATLNNAGFIEDMDIRIGDNVFVEKGGEIIPKITGVDLKSRPSDAVRPKFPEFCPDCGTKLVKELDEAKYFCPNRNECPTQAKGRLLHFLSRKAMNIIAGEATIEQLYNLGLVKTPADFYSLTKADLLMMEGWKDKSAERFLSSIIESKNVDFARVLFALGIRYVGETTAQALALHFGDIDHLSSATRDELLDVQDIGEVIADSILAYFKSDKNKDEIQRLKSVGLRFNKEDVDSPHSQILEGKTIVISGNFSISRDEMKKLISLNGGKNSGSISGKTFCLLAGTKPGPEKIKKAESLGIKIMDEAEFMELIGGDTDNNDAAPQDDEDYQPTLFDGLL